MPLDPVSREIRMCREWQRFINFLNFGHRYHFRGYKDGVMGEDLWLFSTIEEMIEYFESNPPEIKQYDKILGRCTSNFRKEEQWEIDGFFLKNSGKSYPSKKNYQTDEYGAIIDGN